MQACPHTRDTDKGSETGGTPLLLRNELGPKRALRPTHCP